MNETKKTFFLKIQSLTKARIFKDSWISYDASQFVMAENETGCFLAVQGQSPLYRDLDGEAFDALKICPCSHENRLVLNYYFDFTRPIALGSNQSSFGFGDRLGLITPAHIDSVTPYDIKPVLAQQSMRELALTGRSYRDVLDDVVYAVLKRGYREGFGADADHLKEEKDIEAALALGYSMVTVDCSEVLRRKEPLAHLPSSLRHEYLESTALMDRLGIFLTEALLQDTYTIYGDAVHFLEEIFNRQIRPLSQAIDLEISLDETEAITHPFAHYFVAHELKKRGITFTSIAPKFVGEFQKGIDYIGSPQTFESHLASHVRVADHFAHKLSLHSGSDKFSIFPSFAKQTTNRFHIKTSGTSWLESLRVVAQKDPDLFSKIFSLSIEHFEEARKLYQVRANIRNIMAIDRVNPEDYVDYLDEENARQCLHIAYGYVLADPVLRKRLFYLLNKEESYLYQTVHRHLDRHLTLLGRKRQ
jgi:hypothetical protein